MDKKDSELKLYRDPIKELWDIVDELKDSSESLWERANILERIARLQQRQWDSYPYVVTWSWTSADNGSQTISETNATNKEVQNDRCNRRDV